MVDLPRKKAPWWTRTGTAIAADGTPLAFALDGPGLSPTSTTPAPTPGADPGQPLAPLVCSNGVGVSTFFWDYVADRFARERTVLVWDYRGHGASGRPTRIKDITMASNAEDLARVLDAAGIERAVLLGHSMGCQVILEFWHLFPDRVLGLVPMLGTFGHAADTFLDPRVGRTMYRLMYSVANALPELVNRSSSAMIKSPLAWPFARLTGLVHGDLARREDMEPYMDHMSRLDMRVFIQMVHAAQEHDAEPFLPSIRVPALVVAAERDLFTPRHLSLEMAQRIRDAELLEIPRGSHAALVEQPELINLRLEKFLRERVAPFAAQTGQVGDGPRSALPRPPG